MPAFAGMTGGYPSPIYVELYLDSFRIKTLVITTEAQMSQRFDFI
jgi:hypothetical protein